MLSRTDGREDGREATVEMKIIDVVARRVKERQVTPAATPFHCFFPKEEEEEEENNKMERKQHDVAKRPLLHPMTLAN